MGSGERKLTLYTNGEKVREVEIQHEKKRSLKKYLYKFEREIYNLLKKEKSSS